MTRFLALMVTLVLGACGTPDTPDRDASVRDASAAADADMDAGLHDCPEGAVRCTGRRAERCEGGAWHVAEECPVACLAGLGCVVCRPNTAQCIGNKLSVCSFDGSSTHETICADELECDARAGACVDPCAVAAETRSYIGCEYWPTVSANISSVVDGPFDFAVAVANLSPAHAAYVEITGGALEMPRRFEVRPGGVHIEPLPWVEGIAYTDGRPMLAPGAAYRLVSSRPVVAYQFNPLQYQVDEDFSYTNDASLLFPSPALDRSYYAVSYPFNYGSGLVAVTATADDTEVTVTPSILVPSSNGVPEMPPGEPTRLTLNRGDVLQLATAADGELTGTRIDSNRPIQVLGGHVCATIPQFSCCCDHLEESMLPVSALGARYLVTAPAIPPAALPKAQLVRVIATEDDTSITFDPPVVEPTTIERAGEFVEFTVSDDFLITGDKKILVAQYMMSQFTGGDTGDPALTLAVPVEQYRTEYLFHAPINYEVQYVNVTAPNGALVELDGRPVTLTPIGTTGWSMARVPLDLGPRGDGNHTIRSSMGFGITVYGYGQYTSYWYTGGLNLQHVAPPG